MSDPASKSEGWLTFAGDINNHACGRLFHNMARAVEMQLTRLHLLIQSAGGYVGDGIAMYNLLLRMPIEIVTYNGGATESAAVLPYLAGKVRRASKNATFLIHRAICPPLPAGANAVELRNRADKADLDDANIEEILRKYLTNMPDENWRIHATRDLSFSAEDAMRFGIVHEISDFAPEKGAPFANVTANSDCRSRLSFSPPWPCWRSWKPVGW